MTFNYSNVYLNETSTISGHLEKDGNYGSYFDKSYKDYYMNEKSFEKAEVKLFSESIEILLKKLDKELNKYYTINENGNGQEFELVTSNGVKKLYIENSKSNIAVGSIQIFLDEYLKNNSGKIDYIHGDDVTKELTLKGNNVGFIFKPMKKEELFRTVILDGALPRKTFSMGHSYDKRYYLEARKIK